METHVFMSITFAVIAANNKHLITREMFHNPNITLFKPLHTGWLTARGQVNEPRFKQTK